MSFKPWPVKLVDRDELLRQYPRGFYCEITLPIRTVSETNQREFWAARHRRRRHQRQTVALVMSGRVVVDGLRAPCIVTLTRIAPRSLDSDNLQGALKATRDGVADALGVDDSDARVTWVYGQEKGAPRAYGVRIQVEMAKPTKGP